MLREYAAEALKILIFIAIAMNFVHPRQSKIARLTVGIVAISVVMLPLVDILTQKQVSFDQDLFDNLEDDVPSDGALEKVFENAIAEYVEETYGLDDGEVRVSVDGFDLSSMKAKRIYVSISGKGLTVDYRSLEDKLEKEFTSGGDCEVELNIG